MVSLKTDQANEQALIDMLAEIKKNHSFKYGSPEYEAFLSAGYPEIGTRKHAEEIIKTRQTNPMYYPYELEQKARAFLLALDYKPEDHPQLVDPHPYIRQK
jgi:hypothetical protein